MAKKRTRRKNTRRRTARKGLKGLGMLRGSMARTVVPPMVGGVATIGSALGIRAYLRPAPGTTAEAVYKYAPLIGLAPGALSAMFLKGAMKGSAGTQAAASAFTTSTISGLLLFAMERLNANKAGATLALGHGAASLPAGGNGTEGLRAVVPEREGMGAIVMQELDGGRGLGYANVPGSGENVSLQGVVNSDAFGANVYS